MKYIKLDLLLFQQYLVGGWTTPLQILCSSNWIIFFRDRGKNQNICNILQPTCRIFWSSLRDLYDIRSQVGDPSWPTWHGDHQRNMVWRCKFKGKCHLNQHALVMQHPWRKEIVWNSIDVCSKFFFDVNCVSSLCLLMNSSTQLWSKNQAEKNVTQT